MEPPADPEPNGLPIPSHLRRRFGSWTWTKAYENEAGGVTWRLEGKGSTRYLKLAPLDFEPSLDREARRMEWAFDHLPVPVVIGHGRDAAQWLLTESLAGEPATAPARLADPLATVKALGRGLRQFHAAPVEHCGHDARLDVLLARAQQRVRDGLVDPARHFHGEHRQHTPQSALEWLEANRPLEDGLVVCHGDYCFPNVLLLGERAVGFVDLGELGVADRWWDLAVATWSTKWNVGEGYTRAFLDAYGIRGDANKIAYYRLLYDVVA